MKCTYSCHLLTIVRHGAAERQSAGGNNLIVNHSRYLRRGKGSNFWNLCKDRLSYFDYLPRIQSTRTKVNMGTNVCYQPTRVIVTGQLLAVRPLVVALHLVVTEADPPTTLVGNWARHNTSISYQEIVD